MTLRIVEKETLVSPELYAPWVNLLDRMEQYSFFQTPAWSQLLLDTIPNSKAHHQRFRFTDNAEVIVPAIAIAKKYGLWKIESLPWGTYGGLLSDQPLRWMHWHLVMKAMIQVRYPAVTLTHNPSDKIKEYSRKRYHIGSRHVQKSTHSIILPFVADTLWKRVQPRTRTAIRKAQRHGVRVEATNDCKAVDSMIRLYEKACKRWDEVPTVPLRFFEKLEDYDPEKIKIWLAYLDSTPIAGDIILYGKREAQYFTGAMDMDATNLAVGKMLLFEVMKETIERGYALFNFGASGGLKNIERTKENLGGEVKRYWQIGEIAPWMAWLQG